MKALSLILLLIAPIGLYGQSGDTVLGGSQMLGMAGVQTSFQYKGRFGWTSFGYYNGLASGAYLNTPLRFFTAEDTSQDKYRLGLGDQGLDSSLAVDEYSYHIATGRGASLLRHTQDSDLQVFVGKFAAQNSQPYLSSPYQTNPDFTGAISGRLRLSKTLFLKSYNTFGETNTSIQSLAWTPKRFLRLSTAEGIGSNHLFIAAASELKKGRLSLRASYTLADNSFHRQDSTYSVEPLGFNAKAEIPLGEDTTFQFNHRHELLTVPRYLGLSLSSTNTTSDTVGITSSFLGFRVSGVVSQSSGSIYPGNDYNGVASISRTVLPRWKSSFSYLHSVGKRDVVVYQNINEFRLSNHLSFSQNLNAINGSLSNTFGGRWSSNRITLSVENQVYTSAVASQFGQKSVFMAWTFSIRLRTSHGTSTHLETVVDPMGKTQWAGYLSGLQYRALNGQTTSPVQHVNFSRYVIRGKVVDQSGKGVWGIALKIGADTVMSDSEGSFFVHVKNAKPVPIAVAADASLQSLHWTLDSAPPSAQGTTEDNAPPIRVVVQLGNRNRETMQARVD
jgi:hypothetical protein